MDVDEESSSPIKNTSKHNEYLTVVPWRNAEQFIRVYKGLYSSTIICKQWALDQINVWETRCHPSLSSAIEATTVLVGAVLQDMLYESGNTFCRDKDIQSLYSMAIVRFVNLTLETDVKEKLTVLAEKRNIPSWIVDLRHDVSHATTPSLPMLRMGATIALEYLDNNFWKVEAAKIRPIVKTPTGVEEKVIDVITKFKNVQFCIEEDTGNTSELEDDLRELIAKIRSLVKNHNQKFVEAFVKPGVFLSAEEIIQLVRFDGDILFLENENYMFLPKVLLKFWRAVFRILHTFELISYFLEMLLLSLENCRNIVVQKTAVAWAIYLFTAILPCAPKSELSQRFRAKGVQLYLNRLLYASMKGINKFTLNIFQLIVEKLGGSRMFEELYCIMALQAGLLLPKDGDKPAIQVDKGTIVFTAEDLEKDFYEVQRQKLRTKKENIWSLAPINMDFTDLPLGAIINPAGQATNRNQTSDEEVDMDESEESFILFDENDKEPTVEVKSTPDDILLEEELGDMIYRR